MPIHKLYRETLLNAPIDAVFEFFSRAENLAELTPSWLHFEILTALPIVMAQGALIEYRIRLLGVPMHWVTRITLWEPGNKFVDEQLKGPYSLWIHEHRFESKGDRTMMIDDLKYRSPGWILEPIITGLFVGPSVKRIFDFRSQVIEKKFS